MNILDRVIAAVSPQAGEARVRARSRMKTVMNYDAASKGRRTYGWKAPGTAADAAALGARTQLRNLSRDMIRNRWIAARAQSVIAANVVGSGIPFSVEVQEGYQSKKAEVEAVLAGFLGTAAIDAGWLSDLATQQAVVMNAVFSDGEILVRRRMRDPRLEPDLAFGFQIELIEPDFLDTSKIANGQNEVIDGVEIGPTGRVEAYHLFREHPGGLSFARKGGMTSERVPAANILHIARRSRPGQIRGVPWLSPVMMTVGELSDYQEAQILKQRMAALLAAVVSNSDGGEPYKGQGLEELAPGAVLGLEDGQTVTFTTPPRVDGHDLFMKMGIAAVAAGVGITYESLSGDLTDTNFTSFRAGRMEMDRNVEIWQQQIMVAQFCKGIERWLKQAWRLSPHERKILPADDFSLAWTPPVRALVEPNKEVGAIIKSIEAGLVSKQRAQRRLGEDPDQTRREIQEDREKDSALPEMDEVKHEA